MKRFDLMLVVDGVIINYSFFEREKLILYLQRALDTGKIQNHFISEVNVIESGILR